MSSVFSHRSKELPVSMESILTQSSPTCNVPSKATCCTRKRKSSQQVLLPRRTIPMENPEGSIDQAEGNKRLLSNGSRSKYINIALRRQPYINERLGVDTDAVLFYKYHHSFLGRPVQQQHPLYSDITLRHRRSAASGLFMELFCRSSERKGLTARNESGKVVRQASAVSRVCAANRTATYSRETSALQQREKSRRVVLSFSRSCLINGRGAKIHHRWNRLQGNPRLQVLCGTSDPDFITLGHLCEP